jgi:hypothetical protein
MATRTIRGQDGKARPGLTSEQVRRAVAPAAARARVPVTPNGGTG